MLGMVLELEADNIVNQLKDGQIFEFFGVVPPRDWWRTALLNQVQRRVRKDDNFVLLSGSEAVWKPGWVASARARRLARATLDHAIRT
jgi:hypothetical protein